MTVETITINAAEHHAIVTALDEARGALADGRGLPEADAPVIAHMRLLCASFIDALRTAMRRPAGSAFGVEWVAETAQASGIRRFNGGHLAVSDGSRELLSAALGLAYQHDVVERLDTGADQADVSAAGRAIMAVIRRI